MVFAKTVKEGAPVAFRNYDALWDFENDCEIWQACRATSAAPTIFPPPKFENPPKEYVDGGIGYVYFHSSPSMTCFPNKGITIQCEIKHVQYSHEKFC